MAEIILRTGEVAYVDDEDLERVLHSCKSWRLFRTPSGNTYAQGRTGKDQIFLHWLITGHKYVDHIDNNGLNNRKVNLRPANKSQNAMNRTKISGTSSQYKGVSWYRAYSRWRVMIMVDRKAKHIGYYDDEIEAAKAYDSVAQELFGDYARLNFR